MTHPWKLALSLHHFKRQLDPEVQATLLFFCGEPLLKMLLLEIFAGKVPVRSENSPVAMGGPTILGKVGSRLDKDFLRCSGQRE